METALRFWQNADIKKLAEHWHYEEKLPYDFGAVRPHLVTSKGVWDAASGDNRLIELIQKSTNLPVFASDLNPVGDAKQWNLADGIPPWLPSEIDTVLLFGVIQYLDDSTLQKLFLALSEKKVIIKSACDERNIHICKYSEEMGGEYESYYRSAWSIVSTLLNTHNITWAHRVYPDDLESKYETVQYVIVGEPCVEV